MPEISVQPEVEQSLDKGDGEPRRLGPLPVLGVTIRAGVPTREVPPDYWHEATDLHGHAQAVVECPCGHRPVIAQGAYPTRCQCQRWFFYGATLILALAGPESDPATS